MSMNNKKVILIVDDNRDFANSLKEAFEEKGHKADLAFSGEEAMCMFFQKDYDITFMDVKLPGMDGVESFLNIRKKKPDARITMMTGYQIKRLLTKALDHGALRVLHKPFSVEEALVLVEMDQPSDFVIMEQ